MSTHQLNPRLRPPFGGILFVSRNRKTSGVYSGGGLHHYFSIGILFLRLPYP